MTEQEQAAAEELEPRPDVGEDAPEPEEELDPERELRKQLALSQIRSYGDPVLRMRANEVTAFDDELERLAERMISLMHDADGIGLAATQLGIVRRFFVFHDDGVDRVVVNPVVTEASDEKEMDEEGCLSLRSIRVPVERPSSVTIEGQNEAGEAICLELDGLSARAAQHELDHLDGTLIIDRTDPESRRTALSELRPRVVLTRG